MLPRRHLTLRTHLPPEALASRIAQEVEGPGPGDYGRAFRGQVHAAGFDLVPVLRGRVNSWRPRVLGSILAFDLKGDASYQSAQSQALKAWFLTHGLNIRPLGPTVYLMPPYCITDAELARAYAGLIEGLHWLAAMRP